jgi:hypothetical protein
MKEYDSLVEAIRDMRADYSDADHFIVNPDDADGSDLPLHIDDEGIPCYRVDGVLVYAHPMVPPGQIGAHLVVSKELN